MTLENLMSQMGIGSKQITDRYSPEYGAPVHDQHIYYAYEPSPSGHGQASSKHHHSSSGLKTNASMSALTLLAFLFFLHILQQCIKEHMNEMTTAPVVVMTAGREGEDHLGKTSKIDKVGETIDSDRTTESYAKNPFGKDKSIGNKMTRVHATEHFPRDEVYGSVYKNGAEKPSFQGFVSAMDEP